MAAMQDELGETAVTGVVSVASDDGEAEIQFEVGQAPPFCCGVCASPGFVFAVVSVISDDGEAEVHFEVRAVWRCFVPWCCALPDCVFAVQEGG